MTHVRQKLALGAIGRGGLLGGGNQGGPRGELWGDVLNGAGEMCGDALLIALAAAAGADPAALAVAMAEREYDIKGRAFGDMPPGRLFYREALRRGRQFEDIVGKGLIRPIASHPDPAG